LVRDALEKKQRILRLFVYGCAEKLVRYSGEQTAKTAFLGLD
jgi:hypothetical protein